MLRNLILGQYVYRDSFIHRLDPRIKISSVILISIALFLAASYYKIIFATLFIIVIALASKIRFNNILKNLRPFILFFILIFLMYVLFSRDELAKGIVTIWKFILLIIIASILTFSTTISDLVLALEKLLCPLNIIKIKSRDIAVMVSITIRFIPLLFVEANKIRDAKISRLANLKKIKHIKLMIIPLLNKLFRIASNLSDAMLSRCYRSDNVTHMKKLRLGIVDYIAAISIISVVGVLLWM